MRTPVIILSGFLGSGKTTLLLSLLQECSARGLKPGILMNELGKRDVDGYILEEQTGMKVQKMLDGCVCCSRKNELPDSLHILLQQQPDLICIELTGVADPDEIHLTLQEPGQRDRLQQHYTVTLLDAENALEYNSRLSADKQLVRTLRKQIETANLVAVNKSDLAEPEAMRKLDNIIRKHNAEAEIVYTEYSKINLSPLLDGIAPREAKRTAVQRAPHSFTSGTLTQAIPAAHDHLAIQETQKEPTPSFSKVNTVTLTFPQTETRTFSPSREQLESFFHGWGDGLLRAKGHVMLSDHGPVQLVQYAGTRTSWEASRYPGSPYIVFIGMNLNEGLMKERWSALFH